MAEAEERETVGTGQPAGSDKNGKTIQIVKPSKVRGLSDADADFRDGEC